MSEDRDRINRIAAEQMLSPTWVGWSAGSDPLGDLLAAQAAAAREDQRVAPVRGAHRSPARATRKHSIVQVAIARLATAKAVVAAITVGGGVALAAGTGHMPGMNSSGGHDGARLPAELPGTSQSPPAGDWTSTAAATSAWPSASGVPSGGPSANVRDLCVAFDARRGAARAAALDDPAFAVLITAAGGKANVVGYCTVVASAAPGSPPSAQPGDPSSFQPPGTPSSSTPAPSGTPSPTGPPAPTSTPAQPGPPRTHPSGPPSTHPAGRHTGQPSARS